MDVLVKYERREDELNGKPILLFRRVGTNERWWTLLEEGERVGRKWGAVLSSIRGERPTDVPKVHIYCHGGPCDGRWLSRTQLREATGLSRWFLSTLIDSETGICAYREPDPVLSARGKRAKLAVDAKKNGTEFISESKKSGSGRSPMIVSKAARAFAVLRFAA